MICLSKINYFLISLQFSPFLWDFCFIQQGIPPCEYSATPPPHHPTTPYLNKKSQDRRYIYTISARVHVGSIKMWRVNLFAKQSTIQLFNPIAITSIANCLCGYVRDLILSTGQHMIYLISFVVIFLIEYQANNKNLHKTCAFEARLTMALRSTGSKPVEDWTFSGFFWPISSVAALLRRSVHYFLSTTGENTWNLFHLFENADIVLHSRVICTLLCAVDNNSELTKFSANPRFIFANKMNRRLYYGGKHCTVDWPLELSLKNAEQQAKNFTE